MPRLLLLLGPALLCSAALHALPAEDLAALKASSQHVVIVATSPSTSVGHLFRFSLKGGTWTTDGAPVAVSLGTAGVGKTREGDKKAPQGVFPLTFVFGYAPAAPLPLKMDYHPLSSNEECVDDAASPLYNTLAVPPAGIKPWTSAEKMRRDLHNKDDLYKLGVFVGYNPRKEKDPSTGEGKGSCIFLHIHRAPGRPTAGCSAMAEEDLHVLASWLDPAASPVLIQGDRAFIDRLALPYVLPADHPLFVKLPASSWLSVEMKYAGTDNFMGENLYGDFNACYLSRDAAAKLEIAGKALAKLKPGYKLLAYDCLRPREIQRRLWARVAGTPQQPYVADPAKGSVHNYGFAVDLTVQDAAGSPLDMGTPFDDFTPLAQPKLEDQFLKEGRLTRAQLDNRALLRSVMTGAGFLVLDNEWWHFDALAKSDLRQNHRIVESLDELKEVSR
jgi:zinc D-Ala-D-Ala dipeptidase